MGLWALISRCRDGWDGGTVFLDPHTCLWSVIGKAELYRRCQVPAFRCLCAWKLFVARAACLCYANCPARTRRTCGSYLYEMIASRCLVQSVFKLTVSVRGEEEEASFIPYFVQQQAPRRRASPRDTTTGCKDPPNFDCS